MKRLIVFLISMLPIVELRGAIPFGVAYGFSPIENFILCCVGNMIPIPFILLFIRQILKWMNSSKIKFFRDVSGFVLKKADKNADKITKYATFGLFVFVAIPLPGTGAWTGALVAALLSMKMKYALISIAVGVLVAGILVSCISYGALSFLSWMIA